MIKQNITQNEIVLYYTLTFITLHFMSPIISPKTFVFVTNFYSMYKTLNLENDLHNVLFLNKILQLHFDFN